MSKRQDNPSVPRTKLITGGKKNASAAVAPSDKPSAQPDVTEGLENFTKEDKEAPHDATSSDDENHPDLAKLSPVRVLLATEGHGVKKTVQTERGLVDVYTEYGYDAVGDKYAIQGWGPYAQSLMDMMQ